jgi:para-nitrobenzyl esterase
VASALGCGAAADVAACLRAKDAGNVAVSLPDSALGPARWHFLADGYALPDDPLSLFTAGQWNRMPVLLGNNRDELSAMVYDYLRAANLPTPNDQATYESDVSALYPANASAVLATYPYATYASSPVGGLAQLIADDQYTCPTRQAARALAASGQPVFRYLFVHSLDPADYTDGGGGNSVLGAYHFLEVPFVFHAMAPADFVFSPDEYTLSTQMIDLWGSFGRSGTPSAPGVTWPPYPAVLATGDAGASNVDAGDAGARPHVVLPDPYLAIDVQSASGDGVRTTFCDFWDSQPP